MQRVRVAPRPHWQARVEGVGLVYHSAAGEYWDESAYYEFSSRDIDELERATNALESCCLEAVGRVIDGARYAELGIPAAAIPSIERSWRVDAPSIYGRMDLWYDGVRPPKLLEYNADTPTALLEAAIVQWYWLQDVAPTRDQFNSIHERLIAGWRALASTIDPGVLHCVSMDSLEDGITVTYMRDTAGQAAIETAQLTVREIGWDGRVHGFVDLGGRPMRSVFKLYPWDWMWRDAFAEHLDESAEATQWIEPAWKLVLSSKGILPILWELFPGHPNLLAAYTSPGRLRQYARKPFFSREGANVTLVSAGRGPESGPDMGYGGEGYVYQDLCPLPTFDGRRPVIGSWVIRGEAAGIGVRESTGGITGNLSPFVPHLFG